ncbi:MAG: hypothetical protein WD826_10660 [Actinomycetota bacterium]
MEIGGGGSSGGGGGTEGWEAGAGANGGGGGRGSGDAGESLIDVLDLDEGCLVVVPIVMIVGGVIGALLIVWSAPALLLEVLIDVVLVSSLYRRLSHLDRRSWLMTAVRKTWFPVVLVGLLLIIGGVVIESFVPNADTIGDVFRSPQ